MIALVKPSARYKESFLKAEKEYQKEGWHKDLNLSQIRKDFPEFIKKFRNYEKGHNLPKDNSSLIIYWLVDDEKFIGHLSVRSFVDKELMKIRGHIGYSIRKSERQKGYGKKILKLGLLKAQKLGFKKVLVTCDDDNVASRKIIEANGGIFRNKIPNKGELIRRYWIRIK